MERNILNLEDKYTVMILSCIAEHMERFVGDSLKIRISIKSRAVLLIEMNKMLKQSL